MAAPGRERSVVDDGSRPVAAAGRVRQQTFAILVDRFEAAGPRRSARRGHSRGRRAPGGKPVAYPIAVSGLTARCSGLASACRLT